MMNTPSNPVRTIAELHDASIDKLRAWKAGPPELRQRLRAEYEQADALTDAAIERLVRKP